ncbi:hypothetical protein [Citrobacter sedlakii]|uniref:hypothetical protein n=1 Tax=Citrobacter sedlakii TaxID=67826 RepID=UPI002B237B9A|nr:hypothetical protein [Citrobacter sedlakii]MEB0951533.1 hypothetical protein [Citrobacter sedlakii]
MNKFAFFILSFIPWYKTSVSIDFLSNSYHYYLYDSGKEIKQGNILGNRVKELFLEKENLSGWSYDMKSYAPKLKLTSISGSIVCNDSGIIIINQSKENTNSVQLSKNDPALCELIYLLVKNDGDIE